LLYLYTSGPPFPTRAFLPQLVCGLPLVLVGPFLILDSCPGSCVQSRTSSYTHLGSPDMLGLFCFPAKLCLSCPSPSLVSPLPNSLFPVVPNDVCFFPPLLVPDEPFISPLCVYGPSSLYPSLLISLILLFLTLDPSSPPSPFPPLYAISLQFVFFISNEPVSLTPFGPFK